jgi:hypothetical protein
MFIEGKVGLVKNDASGSALWAASIGSMRLHVDDLTESGFGEGDFRLFGTYVRRFVLLGGMTLLCLHLSWDSFAAEGFEGAFSPPKSSNSKSPPRGIPGSSSKRNAFTAAQHLMQFVSSPKIPSGLVLSAGLIIV